MVQLSDALKIEQDFQDWMEIIYESASFWKNEPARFYIKDQVGALSESGFTGFEDFQDE